MKNKKRFMVFLVILIVSFVSVVIITNKLRNDDINVNASTTDLETNEIDRVEEKKLDNSGYLTLEEDPNADDASQVLPETMYEYDFYREDGKKIVYLTFDDGPSEYVTEEILDVLKLNNVKATFFTLGNVIENNPNAPELLRRMAKEGHSIASHGYSHNYNILYPNGWIDVEAFMNDIKKNETLLKGILGEDFSTRVIRMPGGHGSWDGITALDSALLEAGIYQTDWNSLNGDAEGHDLPVDYLLSRLKETVGDQDIAIVLMHDTDAKQTTVEYLQSAIDYLKSEGFEFRTLK